MPDISIVIPTFNRKELLQKTLQSIFNQTLLPDEVIIVDDHSTDGTIEWLREEYGKEIIIVKNKGRGPGAARNTGFEISTGGYIKFFDSDDIMTRNSLEEQYKTLKLSAKGFVTSPYFYARNLEGKWEAVNNTILNYYPFPSGKTLTQWMARGLFIAIPGMLFKRELINDTGIWRTDITNYEDWDYLWRISLAEPYPEHVNSCAFLYRQHYNQSTIMHFSDNERDCEAAKVFSELFAQNKRNLNFIDRMFLLHLKERVSDKQDSLASRSRYWAYRIYQKLSRLRSGTQWMHFYGAEQSGKLVELYLSNL